MQPPRRDELTAGYRHPYRRWVPDALREAHVPATTAATGTLVGTAVVWAAVATAPLLLVALATLAVVLWLFHVAGAAVPALGVVRGITRVWDEDPGELEAVRARRPHAAERDRDVAHDEWAVAVAERDEALLLLRFAPLPAGRRAPSGTTWVPGRPAWAVTVEATLPYDTQDVAVAAAQLADAQALAAEREEAAADDAAGGAEPDAAARAVEARSTGEALRRLTGQDDG